MSSAHAKPADEQQHARLYNLVEGLCIASGLATPRLYVVDDPAPNAFSIGRDFDLTGRAHPFIRLGFARYDEPELADAVHRMRLAL